MRWRREIALFCTFIVKRAKTTKDDRFLRWHAHIVEGDRTDEGGITPGGAKSNALPTRWSKPSAFPPLSRKEWIKNFLHNVGRQDDTRASRIEIAEVIAQCVPDEFGDRAGELHAQTQKESAA